MERINAETITGIALAFLGILFIYASTVNVVWSRILPADYLIGHWPPLLFWVCGKYVRKRTNYVKEHSHR